MIIINYRECTKQGKVPEVHSRRPFGHGVRSCPGQTFGVLELKVLISYLFPMMDYTVEEELLKNEDVGFAIGTHFKPQFSFA